MQSVDFPIRYTQHKHELQILTLRELFNGRPTMQYEQCVKFMYYY